MCNGWTPERREKQSTLIRQWQPWKRSTGPRTADGKRKVAMNPYKGGARPKLRAIAKALREQDKAIKELCDLH